MLFRFFITIAVLAICLVLHAATPQASAFTQLQVPQQADGWTLTSTDGSDAALSTGQTGLRLNWTRPEKSTTVTLSLKKPVRLPRGARRVGAWIYTESRFWGEKLVIRFLVRDAKGVTFRFLRYGSALTPGSWSYLECCRFRGGELGRLDETMILVDGGLQHHLPVEPLELVGLQVTMDTGNYMPRTQGLEIGDVFADGIAREKSEFYWQTDMGERYLFGDMPFARQPFVLVGDLLNAKGDYQVTWQARGALFGRPVAQGSLQLTGYDAGVRARQQQIPLPINAQGQYWVIFKMRNLATSKITTASTRLKIIRGSAAQLPPLAATVRPAGSLLVVNPQRVDNIYGPGELTDCRVRVWKPETGTTDGLTLVVRRNAYPKGAVGNEERYPVSFAQNSAYTDISLPLTLTAQASIQQLNLQLKAGNATLDEQNEMVGQAEEPSVTPWSKRDSVLHYADIFENGNHLLSCAEWDPRYTQNTDLDKFEEWVRDVKRQNVNTIELFPQWRDTEPMPGVYWWDQLDARMAIIARNGLHAMINLDCTSVPAWMIEESQADEEGMVNGLWGGGGNNVLKSLRSPALLHFYRDYITHMVLRYRNDPTLVAYSSLSIFFDHVWADHPWQGQYVDYSEAAKAGFRQYLRDVRGLTLTELAARWNTPLARWEDVELPRTDLFLGTATIDRPDPRQSWRDFLDYRQWCQESFVTDLVAGTVRKYDDLRPVGTHGLLANAQWYREHNMFICAGSSEGSLELFRKPFPFPKRAESIQMSFYTPYYTAMCMTNLLCQGNLNVQHFWMPQWRWDDSGSETRKTGMQSLAGWNALFQGDLGKATPVQAEAADSAPVLGLLYSRASILYGVRSFHWPRLDDYKALAQRACPVPNVALTEDTLADYLKVPAIIVDPTARILPKETMTQLNTYVQDGGTLILAPTSGMYSTDPADGDQVLRRMLGLPLPTAKWKTADEYAQTGNYAPRYPWDITGKGTPGQQSLSEPNQTASATTAAGGPFTAGRTLVFRLGAYTMYNRDTWADWAHMLPSFIYGRYKEARVPGGTVLATWNDGGPAVTLHQLGKGRVMLLWGTPDWFNWRDALGDIAAWCAPKGNVPTATTAAPYIIAPADFKGFLLVHDATRWAVLRNESTGWSSVYNSTPEAQQKATRSRGTIRIPNLPAARYRVRDITPLLSQGYEQILTREQLATDGISAELIPSESRIFRLDPVE